MSEATAPSPPPRVFGGVLGWFGHELHKMKAVGLVVGFGEPLIPCLMFFTLKAIININFMLCDYIKTCRFRFNY